MPPRGQRHRRDTLAGVFVVGIDVGGTFTDVTAVDEASGRVSVTKVPSQPRREAASVLRGLANLDISPSDVRRLVHGTTVGTNAVLERRGAVVALLTTQGFADLIEIGRTKRNIPALFVPTFVRPTPVVDRVRRFEVRERMLHDGTPEHALDTDDLARTLRRVATSGAEAVAVCFLHSYANPSHEREAARALRAALPDVPVSISVDVVPEYREFERFSTTVLNAYLQPLMDRYLTGLEKSLIDEGYRHGVLTIGSSGGMMTVESARRLPIRTIFSGPAGGVGQTLLLGRHLDVRDLITYDMGGTSTDVCLVKDLAPVVTTDSLLGAFPVKVPQLDIRTVGAGGGSVAWLDVDGSLRVGPRSAGARPGPAAYGLGGEEPTVTDANVVLGRMSATRPLGGVIALDASRAHEAVAQLASRLGGEMAPERLADGIVQIAVARMTSSIREITVERGHDPRDFTLVAFGGAGPMHAIPVAEELGMERVLVPRHPGTFSALGLLVADVKHDDVRTRIAPLRDARFIVDDALREMEAAARARLADDGFGSDVVRIDRSLDLRYLGQAFELAVPLPEAAEDLAAAARDFHERHLRAYGHADPEGVVELVNVRIAAHGLVEKPDLPAYRSETQNIDEAHTATRDVWFLGASRRCPVYERDRLPGSAIVSGPAIVEEFGATTVIFPGWRGRLDHLGNLHLVRGDRA